MLLLPFLLLSSLPLLSATGAEATPGAGRGPHEDAPPRPGCACVLRGTVRESASGLPVADALVRCIVTPGLSCRSDSLGRFRLPGLCPGSYTLAVSHVAYRPGSKRVVIEAGRDSLEVPLTLGLRIHRLEEVKVRASAASPMTSLPRSSFALPLAVAGEFSAGDPVRVLELLPGVTVSGDRPFFRGIGFEQVEALIDGVPAQDPFSGRWLFPPPQAISTAEYLSGAMVAESGHALGGTFSFRLGEGEEARAGRAFLSTDRPGIGMSSSREEDRLGISASGPLGRRAWFYSLAWQTSAGNTPLAYDHARPGQEIFGFVPFGHRMEGSEAASAKLTWRPEPGAWKATAAVVTTHELKKTYHEHYSRDGWVGYLPLYDTYTTFEDGPSLPDSLVYYHGPEAVPENRWRSTLAFATLTRSWTKTSFLRAYGSYARHRLAVKPAGISFSTDQALREWVGHRITDVRHQHELFYAVHGEMPEYEWGEGDAGGFGVSGCARPSEAHDLRYAASGTAGRYRYVSLVPPFVLGSFHRSLEAADGQVYLEDTWYSDRAAWMQVAGRMVSRRLRRLGRSYTGMRFAPSIAFHQPMTTADALHVQAGDSYQFPALRAYLLADTSSAGLDLSAQKVRFVELGLQHHFGQAAVLYLGGYLREYSDVIFTSSTPSELEAAFGARVLPPQYLDTRGLEAVLDHQIRPALCGQASLSWTRTGESDRPVPWSRPLTLRSWLLWQPRSAFGLTLNGIWGSGRPYAVCLFRRGCTEDRLLRGRLPREFRLDASLRWRSRVVQPVQLRIEIYNLLDRRIPSYDFSVYPMAISNQNFLAYYHETGRTDGYMLGESTTPYFNRVDNPETKSAGRSVLLGLEVPF